jgi:hypothetical protein
VKNDLKLEEKEVARVARLMSTAMKKQETTDNELEEYV